jgi:predicted PurR-regulated permease PerM
MDRERERTWASPPQEVTMRVLTLGLVAAAMLALAPLWVPLVLAAWFADLMWPVVLRLRRGLHGDRRAAAAVVLLLAVVVLVPLVALIVGLAASVVALVEQVRAALAGNGTLAGVLLEDGGSPATAPSPRDWAVLAHKYGADAWRTATALAHASAQVAVGLFVFAIALFALAAGRERAYAWLEEYAPMPREAFVRFAQAFRETGRGLLIGTGGTALVQGAVATVTYLMIGLPRAMVLGPLSAVCALIPVVGTGLVWIPVAAELALHHDYVRALVVVIVGAVIESLIDNFLRPVIARYGRLNLPAVVVLVAILAGIAAFGAAGALLGPLLVRLAVEGLAIARDEGLFASNRDARDARDRGAGV